MVRTPRRPRLPLRGVSAFAAAAGMTAAAAGLGAALDPIALERAPYVTFLAASLLVFQVCGMGLAALEMVAGGLIGAWLFVSPRGTFKLGGDGLVGLILYYVTCAIVFLVLRSLSLSRSTAERRRDELREAEAEIRSHHERMRVTLASLADALIAADTEGRVTLFNEAAGRLTGVDPTEAHGRSLADVLGPATSAEDDALCEAFGRVLVQGETFGPVCLPLRPGPGATVIASDEEDGGAIHVELTVTPIRDEATAGAVIGLVLVFRDVSGTRRAARELERAKAAAEAANRAKDRFLAALSHELRTPLTPVLLGISYLLDADEAPESLRPTFDMIRRNVEAESRLIDDLLDAVQLRRGPLTLILRPADAHPLVRQAVESCRAELEAAGVALELDLAAPSDRVRVDPGRTRQVVAILARNAAKFSRRGGRVVVRSRVDPAPAPGRLVVEVEDAGAGIAPGSLARIFEVFEQDQQPTSGPKRGGLGLGLAIARAIVDATGGSLTAASPGLDLGATFTLALPLFLPEPAPAAPRPD